MTGFDRLHPALQHHIVNSLGWKDLRPFQEALIDPLLEGSHAIVLAPTAGGKTEAAFFPIASRMLSEGWTGLSVLYICPIKALLNNLDVRLRRYCDLVGRQSGVWHGDVNASARQRLLKHPPDCLLTTPESLESMLVSTRVDAPSLFSSLRVIIVDEIHAFAGDDRGWHLLAVLERLVRIAGRELQRVGLSATVGNPEEMMSWLAGSCAGPRFVADPPQPQTTAPHVQLDFVGSLKNAATVISRLHRGEKRLVFVDSRARVEELGALLRDGDTDCYVTHSSLSAEQRRDAEAAFASRTNCVIVATSALELGIDIGDLNRVIQIDAPSTVSSFLQRMGRTGRRADESRNCLFLATTDQSLVHAAGLIELWQSGYVEPVEPPPLPYHIVAQQVMALALQERGIERATWHDWIKRVPAIAAMTRDEIERIVTWMIDREILWEDGGVLWFGTEGESRFSHRNYMALLSVFTSPPLIRVLHGRQEIGLLDQLTLLTRREGTRVVLLGGRAWAVTNIDWTKRIAHVVPSDATGRSRWLGEAQGLSFKVCQAMRAVLTGEATPKYLSRRASSQLDQVRSGAMMAAANDRTMLMRLGSRWKWWTFGGSKANASITPALSSRLHCGVESDSLAISLDADVTAEAVLSGIDDLRQAAGELLRPEIDDRALEGLKFSECVPRDMAAACLQVRLRDDEAAQRVLADPVQVSTEM